MERDRYPLIEDGSHARYILRMFLTEADQTGLDTYQCVLSNTVGSTTIEFQVVTGISHTGNKSEDMEEPVNQSESDTPGVPRERDEDSMTSLLLASKHALHQLFLQCV